ncbi:MAG: hypothetical protein AAF805_10100, partial [Planctomycetota bacterium]
AGVLAAAGAWAWFFSDAVGRAVEAGNPGPIRTYTVDVTLGGVTYDTMPVLWIFLASATALVAVSLVTPRPKEDTLAKFFGDSISPQSH